jgi:hypothetical protein
MIPIFNLLTPYHPPAPALNSSSKSPPEENGEESSEQPEDILATTIPFLDPHYAHNMHGDPGAAVLYDSRAFGKLRLKLCDPGQESERQLFAHYVWNASFVLAECIGKGWWWEGLVKGEEEEGKDGEERRRRGEKGEVKGGARLRREDWSVQGESVLELGAGMFSFLIFFSSFYLFLRSYVLLCLSHTMVANCGPPRQWPARRPAGGNTASAI